MLRLRSPLPSGTGVSKLRAGTRPQGRYFTAILPAAKFLRYDSNNNKNLVLQEGPELSGSSGCCAGHRFAVYLSALDVESLG